MTTISERYGRVADGFSAVAATITPEGWDHQSPCPDWSARDVVQHLVDANAMFLGFVGSTQPATISPADDPAAAWEESRAAISAHLDDPAFATAEFENFFGKHTFEGIVDRVLVGDVLTHTSDLATTAGTPVQLDPADCTHALTNFASFGPMLRRPGVFGPEVEVADDAPAQAKLLAYTGRRP